MAFSFCIMLTVPPPTPPWPFSGQIPLWGEGQQANAEWGVAEAVGYFQPCPLLLELTRCHGLERDKQIVETAGT